MNEYLWDRSGPPDPEIQDLERKLAPLRFEPAVWKPPLRNSVPYAAIAASVLVALTAWEVWVTPPRSSNWAVTEVDGQVSVGRRSAVVSEKLRTGQTVATGNTARISLENDDFGQVDLEAGSKLTLVESKSGRETMNLQLGRLHAFIWAPPRQFVVETPYARTIDLGCEYTLQVDDSGNGLVSVETGWVAFQFRNQESFIPEGANCRTSERRGPGIPFYRDAPEEFRSGLQRYEDAMIPGNLEPVLRAARPKDGLTLWHLLNRVPDGQRAAVLDRFAQLVTLPAQVQRAKALARDSQTLDLCWNALQLDDADWWREWKREWKPGAAKR